MDHTTRINVEIGRWNTSNPRWPELLQLTVDQGQSGLEEKMQNYHLGLYTISAFTENMALGFLRFFTQQIGLDEDKPPIFLGGKPIIEAKGVAFAVRPEFRRQGIGRQMQLECIRWAWELGCYQLRSLCFYSNQENQALKLSLGFGVQPGLKDEVGKDTAYFTLPLQASLSPIREDLLQGSC